MVGLRTDVRGAEEAVASVALRRIQCHPRQLRPVYHQFAALPSNIAGLEASLLFASGINPFVAVVGPTGWGKSHLLKIAAEHWQVESGAKVRVRSAASHLVRRGRWDMPGPLLLDDVQSCLMKPRERQALRNALELRVRLGRPTMVAYTADRGRSFVQSILPQPQKWTIANVPAPQAVERQSIMRLLAREHGVELSDRLLDVLSKMIGGSGDALIGAVQRLDLVQKDWTSPDDELLALGIVEPLTDGNRDLCKWVDRSIHDITEPLGLDFCPELTRCLSIHFLRTAMGIAEERVARFYRIEPGDVFSHQQAFRTALEDTKVSRLERICAEALTQSLDRV